MIARIRLETELRRWRRLGCRPLLWWRDDDVRKPTSSLERLLRIADGAPLSLAVIPDGDDTGLAEYLAGAGNVTVGQGMASTISTGGSPASPPGRIARMNRRPRSAFASAPGAIA